VDQFESDWAEPFIFRTCRQKSTKMVNVAATLPTPSGTIPLLQVHLRIRKAKKEKTADLSSIKISRVMRRFNGIGIQTDTLPSTRDAREIGFALPEVKHRA
jgi:hypothetical protein